MATTGFTAIAPFVMGIAVFTTIMVVSEAVFSSGYRSSMVTAMGVDAGGSGIGPSPRGAHTGGGATGLASAGIEERRSLATRKVQAIPSFEQKAPEPTFRGKRRVALEDTVL
jgi:hypothetical protein